MPRATAVYDYRFEVGDLFECSCRFRLNLAYYPILVPIPVVLLPPFQLHTPPPFPISDTYLMY
ncbi:uncharacterized protein K441DRAFT_653437, partial [Cenococcum geophilum 1.58]|uniref:uncharacterized protein n=1 Tax=Cenococcum geophilum 1.58 TaxID=794803 RepID=UPI00358F6737